MEANGVARSVNYGVDCELITHIQEFKGTLYVPRNFKMENLCMYPRIQQHNQETRKKFTSSCFIIGKAKLSLNPILPCNNFTDPSSTLLVAPMT